MPPTTTITSKPSAISGGSVTFIFESNEAGTFECDLDDGGFAACENPKSYDLATGPHTFAVRATDTAGNVDASPEAYGWQVDTSILDTTITAAPGSRSGRNVTFRFTSTRPGTFECKLAPIDAAYAACSSPKAYSNLVDSQNPHIFSVRAVDTGSNVDDTPAAVMWSVDSTGPVVDIASPGARSNATPTIVFNTEPGATYSCRIDSGTPFACASGATPPALSQGSHVVYVAGTDAFGNQGAEANRGFTVDATKPTFPTFDGPAEGGTSGRSVSFTFSASDDSGVAPSLTCMLNGAPPPGGCTSPSMLMSLSFGSYTFSVTATDDVGNSATVSRSWYVTPVSRGQAASWVIGAPSLTSAFSSLPIDGEHFSSPWGSAWDGSNFWAVDTNRARLIGFLGVPSLAPPQSASLVLGQPNLTSVPRQGTSQNSFVPNPMKACGGNGWLGVAEFSSSRVIVFQTSLYTAGMNASFVLGQSSFTTATGGSGMNELRLPFGCWTDGNRFVVADTINSRILIWNTRPTQNGTNANMALHGMSGPRGVFSDGQRLFVADTNNARVLIWNQFPTTSDTSADVVVGGTCGNQPSQMCLPEDMVVAGDNLFVADGGNYRVLVFSPVPTASGDIAASVLGQPDLFSVTQPYSPTANNMQVPRSLVVIGTKLYVTTGDRILGYQLTLD